MTTLFGLIIAAILLGVIAKELMNMVKEHGFAFLVVAYVALLVVGASQTADAKELVEINSLDQFVIVEQLDENTAIVKNISSKNEETLTVDFEQNVFKGRDMTGEGVKFQKTERIDSNHIKVSDVIWG